ncbi:glycosyltransferase family 2 protein [Flavobacterium sp. ARAG 55.4]|uniref:glycosyltransferase family 2 protein n=1 Tax=Flavobacterium sp. ARAG 55.4 TaxID=3451357 RepID=UPI003F449F80
MILIYHDNKNVVKIISENNEIIPFNNKESIAFVLMELAKKYSQCKIVWCHQKYSEALNLDKIDTVFYHDKMMLSYNPAAVNFLGNRIGYVEESPFIKINKKVRYPTWQMSSSVGIIHSDVLMAIDNQIKQQANFDYYLNSIAKISMPLGLLCYSEPELLKNHSFLSERKPSDYTLFKFVKQHYKTRWVFLLFLNLMIYESKFPFLALVYSLFFKKRNDYLIKLDKIEVNVSSADDLNSEKIDVIIPTIGRKQYLYDVLKDLAQQTHLPKKVIIVEQNPLEASISELDYLATQNWPFVIKHIFTHQAGACNARNLALAEVESEWVFLNDDDNRFEKTLLKDIFFNIKKYGVESITTAYPQVNEFNCNKNVMQSLNFGAGNSFIKSKFLNTVKFNMGYEFGYGEDNDFGMQLRNQGVDILYVPEPQISHLKAPMGGFRTKPDLIWNQDKIKPKPSPTVMLYQLLHHTKEQQKGYKTTLFIKYYSAQSIKNPLIYFFNFKKEWKQSIYWANYLMSKP